MTGRYVTALRGPPDGYELPLALREGSMLERLVTDFYLPDGLEASPHTARSACPMRCASVIASGFGPGGGKQLEGFRARASRSPPAHDPVQTAFLNG